MSPQEVAAFLVETIERWSGRALAPPDADRGALVARHPKLPRTLIELWDYVGGETRPTLFTLAHTVVPGFPHEVGTTMRWLS